MKFLKNTIGFVALFAVLPAFAVTTRASVTGAVSSRLPTVAAQRASTATYATTASALLANSDCVRAYTSCMKAEDVCGEDFGECTNRVLFHGKMAQCLGTLTQCNSSGLQLLFGTTSLNSLGTISVCKKYNSVTTGGTTTCKEVGDYTYPTTGSVLGQMIDSAYISNRYDTATCVKQYTTCLKTASVCGKDFGLCTSDAAFNKQKVLCESQLARCETAGIRELFGNDTGDVIGDGRIREMITDGAELASYNAVGNCYDVVDNCVQNACKRNPYKCKAGNSKFLVDAAERVATSTDGTAIITTSRSSYGMNTETDVEEYIRSQCFDDIVKTETCFTTFNTNNKATKKEMADVVAQDVVFSEAYNARISSTAMQTKINGYIEDFDNAQKAACVDVIGKCAIGACGGGNNAICYATVFGDTTGNNGKGSINHSDLYPEIKNICETVINTSVSCVYANAKLGNSDNVFTTLFPQYSNSSDDPLGVVAAINSTLSRAYSPAKIAENKESCQQVAYSCITQLCGTDYVNCYRNRTDVYSNLTATNDAAFNKSMNKVGGVLDYTVVLGLCLNTVKNAPACQEHLDIESAKLIDTTKKGSASWLTSGDETATSVRAGWLSSGNATNMTANTSSVQSTNANGEKLCSVSGDQYDVGVCNTLNANRKTYSEPVYVSITEYAQSQAANGIFRDLIYDAEKEAQAIYNAKLTAEQNACLAMNRGGIVGGTNVGSTYAWVKLRNGRVPASYANDGLSANSFVASNEIYGSFCRVRVMLTSSDKSIQEYMRNKSWATAYFAVGDPFVCGSWIPESDLEELATQVAKKKTGTNAKGDLKEGQKWATAGISLLGGGLGAGITDVLQTKTGLGGLLNTTGTGTKNQRAAQQRCQQQVQAELRYWQAKQREIAGYDVSKKKCTMYQTGVINGLNSSSSQVLYNYNGQIGYVETAQLSCSDVDSGGSIPTDEINRHVNAVAKAEYLVCGVDNADSSTNQSGRAIADVVGGVLVGGLTGVTTWQAMKAANRTKFTEAQQEFMDEVGSKINCVIGNDGYDLSTLGSYGDMMISELDTAGSSSNNATTTTAAGTASMMFR